MDSKRSIGVVLFHEFELLDVFGPLELYGLLPEHFVIHLIAEKLAHIQSTQGPKSVAEKSFADDDQYDILLVPGGRGTRIQINNPVLLDWLKHQSANAEYVTSVCTGSALLAKAGLLDKIHATTNKMAFEWVSAQGPNVICEKKARWVEDGRFFTSSGVSAGMDMFLTLIAKTQGQEIAEQVATWAEYEWHQDPKWDPFAKIHGLVN
ncbi:MAG: DJ-1/PfpI family protein [Gammaproteobacteria bacterium]|nr:DJ-1/PfpI family protein [Gammaproteobacteria bacterium]